MPPAEVRSERLSPAVSVVIATYNCAAFLPQAIESALAQSHRGLEVIIVDDGSTDQTAEVVASYRADSRLRYFHQANGGQASAKNAGVREARGEYVAFLDADDIWELDKLHRQLAVFESDPEVGVVYSDFRLIGPQSEAVPIENPPCYRGRVLKQLYGNNFVPFSSSMVRRVLLEKHGAFDETIKMGIDYDLWLRLSVVTGFDYVPSALTAIRVWHGRMSTNLEGRAYWARHVEDKFRAAHPSLVTPQMVRDCEFGKAYTRFRRFEETAPRVALGAVLQMARLQPLSPKPYRALGRFILLDTLKLPIKPPIPLAAPSAFRIEHLSSPDNLSAAEWNGLLERAAGGSVFQSHEWIGAWWEACRNENCRPVILAVRRNGALVGLAPFFEEVAPNGRRSARRLRFLGVEHADYLDVLIDRDVPEALDVILDYAPSLLGNAGSLILDQVPETAALHCALTRRASHPLSRLQRVGRTPCPALTLGVNSDEVIRRLRKTSVRRHTAKLAQEGAVRIDHYGDAERILPLLDDFFAQHIARWSGTAFPSLFVNPVNRELYRALVRRLCPAGRLVFSVVRLDERPVAYHLGLISRNTFIWYKPSFDISRQRQSPGEVLLGALIEMSCERKFDCFDFSRGDEAFKRRFANVTAYNATWVWHDSPRARRRAERAQQLRRVLRTAVRPLPTKWVSAAKAHLSGTDQPAAFVEGRRRAPGRRLTKGLILGFPPSRTLLSLLTRRHCPIFVYHRFGSGDRQLNREAFAAHLDEIARSFTALPLLDYCRQRRAGRTDWMGTCVITIDDAYRDFYEIAYPELKKRRLPATLFVTTTLLEPNGWLWWDVVRWLIETATIPGATLMAGAEPLMLDFTTVERREASWQLVASALLNVPPATQKGLIDQLAAILHVSVPPVPPDRFRGITFKELEEMADHGITIGPHTLTHPVLTTCSPTEWQREILESRRILTKLPMGYIDVFAYPNGAVGDYDESMGRFLEVNGFEGACVAHYSDFSSESGFSIRRCGGDRDGTQFRWTLQGGEYLVNRAKESLKRLKSDP